MHLTRIPAGQERTAMKITKKNAIGILAAVVASLILAAIITLLDQPKHGDVKACKVAIAGLLYTAITDPSSPDPAEPAVCKPLSPKQIQDITAQILAGQ